MDLIAGVEGVKVLGLVQVPQHGGSVLAARGAQGSVWGDGDGVDVAGVADVVGLETAGRELPNLVIELVCDQYDDCLERENMSVWISYQKKVNVCLIARSPRL